MPRDGVIGGETGTWGEGKRGDRGWVWGRKPWFGVPGGGMKDWAMLMARDSMLFRVKKGWSGGGQWGGGGGGGWGVGGTWEEVDGGVRREGLLWTGGKTFFD